MSTRERSPDSQDLRSNRGIFVSHCILAQAVRANGLAKYYPAAIKPVLQLCLDNDINIFQMPCPETLCTAGGLGREPHGKQWYEKAGLRPVCSRIAKDQVAYMRQLTDAGLNVLAVVGIEFSPACAVTYLNRGPIIRRDQGIFIEELKRELSEAKLAIPFVGINPRHANKTQQELQRLFAVTQ